MTSLAALRPRLGAAWNLIVREWASVIYVLLATALLACVRWDAFGPRIVSFGQGSDVWEHTATLRVLMDDLLHPKNPHLVSPASSPRFTPHYILITLLSRLFGARDALDAFGVASVVNTLLFVSGIYAFFRIYFNDARAPLYALIISLCGWWDAWSFSNVYQLSVFFSVAGYPSTAALGVAFWAMALVTRSLRGGEPRIPVLLSLVGISFYLLLTHPLTAVFGHGAVFLLCLFLPDVARKRRLVVLSAIVTGAALAHLWPYFSPFKVMLGGDAPEAQWVERTVERAKVGAIPRKLHEFYDRRGLLRALGIGLLGLPIALGLFFSKRHRFIALGAVGLLGLFALNVFVRVPLGHRIVLLAIPFLHMAVVWVLLKLTPGFPEGTWLGLEKARWRRIVAALVIVGVLAPFVKNGVERAQARFAIVPRRYRTPQSDGSYRSSPVVTLGRTVAEHAGPNAVVLADILRSWSVPTFGPKVVAILHKNPLVSDNRERTRAVELALGAGTSDERRSEIIGKYGVTHVLVSKRSPAALKRFLAARGTRTSLPEGYDLYELSAAARMDAP